MLPMVRKGLEVESHPMDKHPGEEGELEETEHHAGMEDNAIWILLVLQGKGRGKQDHQVGGGHHPHQGGHHLCQGDRHGVQEEEDKQKNLFLKKILQKNTNISGAIFAW